MPPHDKLRTEWVVPVPGAVIETLRAFQRLAGAVGGWVFASATDANRPMDRHLFDKWLSVAERKAGLAKPAGSLWHAYRRAWATSRKNHPLKDVAAAGGWRDTETLLQVYQQPTNEALLAVMSEERKVRDVSVAGGNG